MLDFERGIEAVQMFEGVRTQKYNVKIIPYAKQNECLVQTKAGQLRSQYFIRRITLEEMDAKGKEA